jgi:hypothetical protein
MKKVRIAYKGSLQLQSLSVANADEVHPDSSGNCQAHVPVINPNHLFWVMDSEGVIIPPYDPYMDWVFDSSRKALQSDDDVELLRDDDGRESGAEHDS